MAHIKCILAMPTYNEEACINEVVTAWHEEFSKTLGSDFRIVVVDDGSKDKTGLVLENLQRTLSNIVVIHQENGGHGNALLKAYKEALKFYPDFVFQTDSDNQFSPSDFKILWSLRDQSQMLLGYRRNRNDALHRLIITRILRLVIFGIFGTWIIDPNIPFRLYSAKYLDSMLKLLPADIFAPNIFLSVLAKKNGTDLKSIPITHLSRKTGQVSIVRLKLLKACVRSVFQLVNFRLALPAKLKALGHSISTFAA